MTKFIISIVLVIGVVAAVLMFKNKEAIAPENGSTSSPQPSETVVFCTQDAKACPDGSYVGRQGPNCEFAPCPSITPTTTKTANPTVSAQTSPSISPKISPTPSATPKPQTIIITFTNNTATPNNVNIKVGDTVKFINNDASPRWPASGVHPTHQICPGFDSLRGLNTNESYSFTFNTAKTCPWHDHLKPAINGQIVVNP